MPVKFRKVLISDERFEACGVFDVNNRSMMRFRGSRYLFPDASHRNRQLKTDN